MAGGGVEMGEDLFAARRCYARAQRSHAGGVTAVCIVFRVASITPHVAMCERSARILGECGVHMSWGFENQAVRPNASGARAFWEPTIDATWTQF